MYFRATFSERQVSASGVTVYELTLVGGTPSCALSPSSTASGLAKPSSIRISPSRFARSRLARHRLAQLFFGERLALDQDFAERRALLGSARLLAARDDAQRRAAASFTP